jgi:anti-sigma28 factor (negative regulator of flagellin synthesis)
MKDIPPLHPGSTTPPGRLARPAPGATPASPSRPAPPPDAAPTDRVELSEAANRYEPVTEPTGASEERIREIRSEIATGRYITDDKIDVVVDRLLEVLLGENQA